jgi:hypothetical protein
MNDIGGYSDWTAPVGLRRPDRSLGSSKWRIGRILEAISDINPIIDETIQPLQCVNGPTLKYKACGKVQYTEMLSMLSID